MVACTDAEGPAAGEAAQRRGTGGVPREGEGGGGGGGGGEEEEEEKEIK